MSEPFDAVDVIRTKRDGGALSDAQIDWVIDAYTRGAVAEEQMAALAMAILLNGMDRARDRPLDRRDDRLRRAAGPLRAVARPTADKHSTGGVGDKITLPLAPAGRRLRRGRAAAVRPRARATPAARWTSSSRSPAGGPRCPTTEFLAQLDDVGAVVCAAGAGLAPADRKLYALRDVTGTVESIPLIASSIMSKKIAEGTGRARARRQGRHRRVHEGRRRGPRAGRRRWSALGTDARRAHGRAADRHVHPARAHRRQRARGARVGRGARRRRPGGRRRADPRAGPRDARRRRASTTSTRPTRCATAGPWTSGAR